MMILGIINCYYSNRRERGRRYNEGGDAVTPNHYYSPSFQPKTTTNKLSNPKDASNIHSPHHHYHI